MSGKFAVYGVIFLVSTTFGGVVDLRLESREDKKEPEKKPNIVKDYICLRDGELCHPNFINNRGVYVSCSNGVAWEQTCPKCSYHPLNCPTKSLWFDGEKCEWASPKLASQPCIDRFPVFEVHNTSDKDLPQIPGQAEQEALLQSLHSAPVQVPIMNQMKEQPQLDKNKWPGNPLPVQNVQPPIYFKSPKSGELDNEPSQELDAPQQELIKAISEQEDLSSSEEDEENAAMVAAKNKILRRKSPASIADEDDEESEVLISKNKISRKKFQVSSESDFPSYLSPEDAIGSKIVRLSEPVYAMVNSPDGSGKQVLMRVFQPFVFEDSARTLLPNMNTLNPYSDKH